MPTPPRRKAIALTPEKARTALALNDLGASQRAMLGVFLLAGLRLGEHMALTRGQILDTEGLTLIDRFVKLSAKSAQSVGLPKGDKVRTAVMCESLKSLLAPLLSDLKNNDLFWTAATNKLRMKKLVYSTWNTIITDAKLPSDMSPHDCRLTHINWIE